MGSGTICSRAFRSPSGSESAGTSVRAGRRCSVRAASRMAPVPPTHSTNSCARVGFLAPRTTATASTSSGVPLRGKT